MRNVAVTEGDKVGFSKFGWETDVYNITDIAEYAQDVSKEMLIPLLKSTIANMILFLMTES